MATAVATKTKKAPQVDYVAKVHKYAPDADPMVVGKIVKHLGIALRKADSRNVAASDPSELARLKKGFCTKKLGLNAEAADVAIARVCQIMKGDRAKNRVTFCYLLAQESAQLDKFA